jgi:hypothetical protein
MANEASNNGDPGSVQLTEVLKQNQIIGGGSTADGMPFAVATARTRALDEMTTASAMRELAYASPSPWTSWLRQEHVPELRDRMGLRTYYRMKRADGTVRGSLRRSFEPEAGDLTGTPILRSAYQHYYYKYNLYKIDAIQKERHGTGIPIIILPLGYTDNDKKAADELGRNIRTNERAHVVLPPGWTLEFAKMPTQPVDPMKSIEHHDRQIEKTMMVPQGEKDDEQNTFFKSTRSIAEMICDTINRHAIPELVDANFSRVGGEYPQLRARRIGEFDDARTQSFAVRNYVGAGVIIPDEPLEKQVRIDLDLPAPDPTTARGVPTRTSGTSLPEEQAPGAPSTADVLGQPGDGAVQGKPAPANKPLISNITPGAKVGPTRQQPLPPVGTPKGNAGLDRSGG